MYNQYETQLTASRDNLQKQESIPVGYVPPACQLYQVVSKVQCVGGGMSTHG